MASNINLLKGYKLDLRWMRAFRQIVKPGMKILDIGCGEKALYSRLAVHYGAAVTAIDIDRKITKLAPKGIDFIQMDALNLGVELSQFNLILFLNMADILGEAKTEKILNSLLAQAKPGTKIFIGSYPYPCGVFSVFFYPFLKNLFYITAQEHFLRIAEARKIQLKCLAKNIPVKEPEKWTSLPVYGDWFEILKGDETGDCPDHKHCEGTTKYKEIVQKFEKDLKRSPRNKEILRTLGRAYDKLGDYGSAVEYFNKALEVDPLDIRIWYTLAGVYKRMGNFEEARRAYRKVLAIVEQIGEENLNREQKWSLAFALIRLGSLYVGQGKKVLKRIISHLEKALEILKVLDPHNPAIRKVENRLKIIREMLGKVAK